MPAAKSSRPPARAALVKTVTAALDDMKAVNVKVMDVRAVSDVSDCMVLASGNSDRHVRSIADRVVEYAKAAGFRPMGVEGQRDGEWVLVDLNDVLVHVMLPRVREFYSLEELWEPPAPPPRARKSASGGATKAGGRGGRSAAGKTARRKAGNSSASKGATRGPGAATRAPAKKSSPRKSPRPAARGGARGASPAPRAGGGTGRRGTRSRA